MALVVLIKSCFFEVCRKTIWIGFYKIKTFELCDKHILMEMKIMMMLQKFLSICDRKNYYVLYIDLVNYKRVFRYILKKIPVDKWIKKILINIWLTHRYHWLIFKLPYTANSTSAEFSHFAFLNKSCNNTWLTFVLSITNKEAAEIHHLNFW
jgi:hypothetical protein